MQFYTLTVSVSLKKDIHLKDTNFTISANIRKSMLLDEELKKLHDSKRITNYVFSYPYPRENDKLYKARTAYKFQIKSFDESIIDKLKKALQDSRNLDFYILEIHKKTTKQFFVEKIYNTTPAVITVQNEDKKLRCALIDDMDLDLIKKRLIDNLEKKYETLFGEPIKAPQNALMMLSIKNNLPIVTNFKKGKLLGHKFEFVFSEDEVSQKLAFLALGSGIYERNGNGYGFCLAGV
jgi:CRISPR-associated endoribonuclease Cas6